MKGLSHFRSAAETLLSILRHGLLENTADFRSYCRIQICSRQQWIGLTVNQGSRTSECVRRFRTCEQMVSCSGQRIEVTARIGTQPLNLFQRSVVWCVTEDAGC